MTEQEFWERSYLATLSTCGTGLAAKKADESAEYFRRRLQTNYLNQMEPPTTPVVNSLEIPF